MSCDQNVPPLVPSDEHWHAVSERLGYDANAKLLIINADDLGMAHSINEATFEALEQGAITSASVMVPCSGFAEVVNYWKEHSETDLGVHLTITSEWSNYRWGPVLPTDSVRSLIDESGYFWSGSDDIVAHANLAEVEVEIVAQIRQAIKSGIRPTHLDSHMFALLKTDPLLEVFVRVARCFKLPLRARRARAQLPGSRAVLDLASVLLDDYFQAPEDLKAAEWAQGYEQMIRSIRPGLNELILHLGFDNQELRRVMGTRSPWGAAWRQRDFEMVMSQNFKTFLSRNDVHLLQWKELAELVLPDQSV